MEILILATFIVIGASILKSVDQCRRIALLGSHLGHYQIEKLMENLTEGYLRCLGEDDVERRAQIWALLDSTEQKLSAQFDSFAAEFAGVDELSNLRFHFVACRSVCGARDIRRAASAVEEREDG